MAIMKKSVGVGVLPVLLLSLAGFFGCGGSDESPTGAAELGEEIDLSIYEPASLDDYEIVYSVNRDKAPLESGVRFCSVETVLDYDPDTGQDISIDCEVFEEESDGNNEPDVRVYKCGSYLYGVKTNETGRWGPLYRFIPRRQVAPEEHPRLGGTFDSKCSCLITRFTMFETEYRQVQSFRSWTTYVAIEDSITVPAGTFYSVLKTQEKMKISTKQTLAADTTAVVFNNLSEMTSTAWRAQGIGAVKIIEDGSLLHVEKEMVRGTVAGVSYPKETR